MLNMLKHYKKLNEDLHEEQDDDFKPLVSQGEEVANEQVAEPSLDEPMEQPEPEILQEYEEDEGMVDPNQDLDELESKEPVENIEDESERTSEEMEEKPSGFSFEEFFEKGSPENYVPNLEILKNLTGKDDLFDIEHIQDEINKFITNHKDKSIDLAVNPKNRDPKINKRAMEDFVDYLSHEFSRVIDKDKKITPGSKKLLDELKRSYAVYPNGKVGPIKFLLQNKDKFFGGKKPSAKKEEVKEEIVEESQSAVRAERTGDSGWDDTKTNLTPAGPNLGQAQQLNPEMIGESDTDEFYIENYDKIYAEYIGMPIEDFKEVDAEPVEHKELTTEELYEAYQRDYKREYAVTQSSTQAKKPGHVGTK